MIWNLFAKTQSHFCRTRKACIHGRPVAHFKDARTTTPRGVPSGASAIRGRALHWVSALVVAGGNSLSTNRRTALTTACGSIRCIQTLLPLQGGWSASYKQGLQKI